MRHALQTNGTLVTEEWARFFADHGFLVGVSIDGPAPLHDAYRLNRGGRGTHAMVVRGWEELARAGVEANILCTVNAANEAHGARVYRYFRDELGARYLQFIPIVERVRAADLAQAERGWRSGTSALLYRQDGDCVTSRSTSPSGYGRFLCEVFDEWVRSDVGEVFIQDVDSTLAALFGQCYSPDFSRMIVANNDGENEKVAVVSTDGTLTVLNDAIPTPSGHTPVSNHFAQFGPDGAIYVAHIDKDAASDRVGTIYRFPSETEAPEAVPTDFTVENYARFQVMPDLSIKRTKTAMWVANEAGVGCFGADAVTPDGTCLTIDQGTIYSKPGTPLAQTTPEDQTRLVSNWTTVSLPGLESTHTIEGWLAVSPDGTQMALYASPKDPYSDLSLPIFVAPVAGGDATQVTTTTEDVPGVVRISGEGLQALAAPRHGDDAPPSLRQQAGGRLPDSGGGSSDDDATRIAHGPTVISPGTHRRARPGTLCWCLSRWAGRRPCGSARSGGRRSRPWPCAAATDTSPCRRPPARR